MNDEALKVLVVDDDADLRDLLRRVLTENGVGFSSRHDAVNLADWVRRERPSIVVLDLMMPGVDGLAALRELRASGETVPVIMLTARADDIDRVVGLELGADDYLGKPFLAQELLARIRAVLRGHAGQPAAHLTGQREPCRFGDFKLDFTSRTLLRNGRPVRITEGEYLLLEAFATHPMQTLSRARLLDLIYGPGSEVTERGIDVPVWRLRRLIEDDPSNPTRLQTRRGLGYMFVPDWTDHEKPV